MVYDQNKRDISKYRHVECPEPVEGLHWVYILRCSDGSYYCGSTDDLVRRLSDHNKGIAAAWTKKRLPVILVHFEGMQTLLQARRREKQLKGWTRAKKDKLIEGTWK